MKVDIKKLLGQQFICEFCGNFHKIDIEEIKFGKLENIGEYIEKSFEKKIKILILCDDNTWEVAGKKIKENLKNSSIPLILKPSNEKRVTAKYEYIEQIKKNIKEKIDLILTVGSGTITDLGKLIGNEYKIPVISFPTAPSMNGYTSPVSAYIKNGIKLTIPVKPCRSIYIDEEIILNAPIELIKSGFADSMAKGFANCDWKISSILLGENFCLLPYEVISDFEKKYINNGDLLIKRDRETILNLMEALNWGGISMIIAGSSSPASGGEHLISHFLDMYASKNRREPFSYHGLQVGTGIYFSSMIYEKLKEINVSLLEKLLRKRKINYDEKFEKLLYLFPEGKKNLKKIFITKLENIKTLKIKLVERWNEIKEKSLFMVYTPTEIKEFLKKANCPFSLKEICKEEELIFNSLILSRFIRDRITILDIADEIGILDIVIKEYIKEQ